jgi:hypothetical protein
MSNTVGASHVERDTQSLHAHFVSILPRVQTHAEVRFRHLRCPGRRADAIQEVIAIAWKWYLHVQEQGKAVDEFVMALADLAVRHVRSGRGLCGQQRARDVLSARAQWMKGFRVERLPASTRLLHDSLYSDPHGQDAIDTLEQRLRDNTITPPPEQAAFRLDYAAWLSRLGARHRAIIEDMILDHRTNELAAKHRVSPARISQMRREFWQDWRRFHGEEV